MLVIVIFAIVAAIIIGIAYSLQKDHAEQALDEFKSTLDILEGMSKELQKRYGK